MKKVYISLLVLLCLYSCGEEIGSLAFDEEATNEFSVFFPTQGTFKFLQEYNPQINPSPVKTSLKVNSSTENQTIKFEIIALSSTTKKYGNITFVKRDTIRLNQIEHKLLDDQSQILLAKEQLQISIFNTSTDDTNISGHYEGVCKIKVNDIAEETFGVFGNIDSHNNLILFSTLETASIDFIKGFYVQSTGNFNGTASKDDADVGIIINQEMPTTILVDNNNFTNALNYTVDSVEKQIELTIQRID